MPGNELTALRVTIDRMAAVIGAPAALLPTYDHTEDGGRPHIEYAGGQYHYVVVERGEELRRDASVDVDDVLYHTFEDVVASMGNAYESRHRRHGEDFRRQNFDVRLRLLGRLSPAWERRTRRALDEVLLKHPFVD